MASVAKRKDSGKWEVRFLDPATGTHRSKSFTMKREADAFRRKTETEIQSGEFFAPAQSLTVKELCFRYSQHLENRLAMKQVGRGHYDFSFSILKTQVIPRLGALKVSELTPLRVEQWVTELRTRGNISTGAGLANSTVRSIISIFKQVEEFGVKHGHARRRNMVEARRGIGTLGSEPIRTFTVDEVRRLVAAVDARRDGFTERDRSLLRCYVYLGAFCGLRIGEISALIPASLDFDAGMIRVRGNLTAHMELKGPKTKAGVRDLPMSPQVEAALREWVALHHRANELGTVFATSTGAGFHRGDMDRRWKRLLKEAGLDEGRSLHFHALRHFAASYLIAQGVPLPDVAKLLGHRTFDTTLQVYAHPVQDTSHHRATFSRMAQLTSQPIVIDAAAA